MFIVEMSWERDGRRARTHAALLQGWLPQTLPLRKQAAPARRVRAATAMGMAARGR